MDGFYWLVEGEVAGCPLPGRNRDGRGTESLTADLGWLWEHGIRAMITLTEDPLPSDTLNDLGFEHIHIPVEDMTAPTLRQLDQALDFIDAQRAQRHPVVVHCLVGAGRTGTILAAWLIRGGMTAEEAIRHVRGKVRLAISSDSQVRALHAFERDRSWIV